MSRHRKTELSEYKRRDTRPMKIQLTWLFLHFGCWFGAALFAQSAPTDTTHHAHTMLEMFSKGSHHGHFRSFMMATDNERYLTDYYAWAAGGDLHFHSAGFHGFSFGIGGNFHFNLASSDLSRRDSVTGAANRYEIGLFDVENPSNRNDLDRMDDFWIRFEQKKWRVSIGKQGIQTPFINFQDGRMRPTAVNGIWSLFQLQPSMTLNLGWIWGISPRSTVRWYDIGTSIGLYPAGLNPDGSASGYPEHLKSKGIALIGLKKHWGSRWQLEVWDQYVEQIFNTSFVQTTYSHPFGKKHRLKVGVQTTFQQALADGGHAEADKTYFEKNSTSWVLSSQIAWQFRPWEISLAYTRTGPEARFLTPREWGREPFYTFMSRERIEGAGDVHAATLRLVLFSENKRWQTSLTYGHFYLPDVKDVRLNKYAFPAFRQLNADVRYTFGGALQGLQAQFLYVWKGRLADTYHNPRYTINRVNLSHINLIINYYF